MINVKVGEVINPLEAFKDCRQLDCNEVLSLLKMYGFKFYSWAPHAFTRIDKYAFRFMVSGHHHKGHVYVCVNGMDLYNYVLVSARTGKVKKVETDIYFEDLFNMLDTDIEKIAAYKD